MEKNISNSNIWHRIIGEFKDENLKYVMVGAAALAIHGLPRSTVDIDIYIEAEPPALKKIFRIAGSIGLKSKQKPILNISHSPKLFANQWICFSYEEYEILDVFLAPKKEFNQLYKNSKIKRNKNISIRVASLKDIKTMKKSIGRPVDIADINLIKEAERLSSKKKKHKKSK